MTNDLADAAARNFYARLKSRGRVSLAELIDRAGVSYKTARKHIADGSLKARREIIGGKVMWTFSEAEVLRYQRVAPALVEIGRRTGGACTPETPRGFTTLEELAARRGCSHWFIRDEIRAGRLPVTRGKRGKVFIADADARSFDGPRTLKGLRINTRRALVNLLLDRYGLTHSATASLAGVSPTTIRRWASGKSAPSDEPTGKMLAFARVKERLSLTPDLDDVAKRYRAEYMREYIARRREKQDVKDRESQQASAYREANREKRRAAEAERYAAKRSEINARRRAKRKAAKIVEGLPEE